MKYYIYYKTGEHRSSGTEYKLLKKALRQYFSDNMTDASARVMTDENDEKLCISKSAKGKPFIHDADIHFSISHTDGLWACAIGTRPCGLDVQRYGKHKTAAVADRMFSAADAEFVKRSGEAGFYEIWSRFEAVAKYAGEGIFAVKPVLSDGTVTFDEVETSSVNEAGGKRKVYLRGFSADDFGINLRLSGALCTEERAEVIIRRLNG